MSKIMPNIILIVFLFITLLPSTSECSNPRVYKIKTAEIQIKMLVLAIQNASVDIGRIPTTEEGLSLLIKEPIVNIGWKGPYIKKGIPNDPWGMNYIYYSPAKHGTKNFDLYSSGSNKIDDQGNLDDITNWRKINLDYYGGLSKKSEVALFSTAAIIFIVIVLLVIKRGTPTTIQVTTRFTRLTVYFFALSGFVFIAFPTFGSATTSKLQMLIFFSVVLGCVIFPIAGLIFSVLEIIKKGFMAKVAYTIIMNIIPLILSIILFLHNN